MGLLKIEGGRAKARLMDAFESCQRCGALPASHRENFLEQGSASIPKGYEVLTGWEGHGLSSGYQQFGLTCPECATAYLAEVDVEPFLWDLIVTRLAGRAKDYRGQYA